MGAPTPLKIACIQFCSGLTAEDNLPRLLDYIDAAANAGAQWVVTPETSNFMPADKDQLYAQICTQEEDPCVAAFAHKAKQKGIWLQAGSFILKNAAGRAVNRSLLFAPNGTCVATYDKIHLFDVALAGGESHRESSHYDGGSRAVLVDCAFGEASKTTTIRLGLSICYDLRFAGLYRQMAEAGAQIMTVPAAFTVPTGKAHWQVLLQARAIETASFIVAPAQAGQHPNGRETYGHSLVIDPWGRILAEKKTGEGVLLAELDMSQLEKTRQQIPVLEHGKVFSLELNNDPL
ncbi:MAG: carbon-nitrogen hydrolase family protein [Parvibaculales bacterium]